VALQRVEGLAVMERIKQYDCFIAHTGSSTVATLPTSYSASNPSDSSPAEPGLQQQVLMMPFPSLMYVL
jgi:hypothetical protein